MRKTQKQWKWSERKFGLWYIPFDKACWSSESDITPLRSLSTLGKKTLIRCSPCYPLYTHPHTWTHNGSRHQQSPAETWSSRACAPISTLDCEWMEFYDTRGSLRALSSPETDGATAKSVLSSRLENETECCQTYKGSTAWISLYRPVAQMTNNCVSAFLIWGCIAASLFHLQG